MAATPGLRPPVAPPAPMPPVQTLFTGLVPQPMGDRPLAGIEHVQGRGAGPGAPQDACSPGGVSITDHCSVGSRTSFIVTAPELRPSQSTYVDGRRTLQERLDSAKFNMDRGLSFVVAREMLYGAATQANTWGNPYLAEAPTVVGAGPLKPGPALAGLTNTWAGLMLGERGVLHVPPAVLREWVRHSYVELRGTQFFEKALGFPVVTDQGYAGATLTDAGDIDPEATAEVVYLSPAIDIRLSGYTYWPSTPEEAAQATAHRTNTLAVWVDRVANYTWEQPAGADSSPPVLAVTVDLT